MKAIPAHGCTKKKIRHNWHNYMITLQSFSAFTEAIYELSIASALLYSKNNMFYPHDLGHKCFMPHSLQE